MAYKVFTNGSPLPASDLNTYLMNQSVMVFTNSTARSAALTAPTEGMVTYLEDTGLVYVYNGSSWVDINDNSGAIPKSTVTTAGDLIVADGSASVTRLGIGSNGQVLSSNGTTATWTTPAAAATTTDWTLLVNNSSIPTGSNAATISFTGGYDKYAIYVDNFSSNSGATFEMRLHYNTSSAVVFDRANAQEWQGATAYFRNTQYNGLSSMGMGYLNSSSRLLYGSIFISGASKAGKGQANWFFGPDSSTANNYGQLGQGHFTIPATYRLDAIRLSVDSGTIDNGQITIFGA